MSRFLPLFKRSGVFKRLISSKRDLGEALYVTTPIFYVNAKPHLGHFYSMFLCDMRIRWEKLRGYDTFFTTGTDEHGLKVQNAANAAGVEPKLFCDDLSAKFRSLAKLGNIEYDRFIRTTDEDHKLAVKHFWNEVQKRGFIYKGTHTGWYAVSDETFYPESQIEQRLDPVSGEMRHHSVETGSEVEFQTEENYFFKLSEFRDALIANMEKNERFIIPRKYYQEVLNELKSQELTDLSISRPSTRLSWGIDVPGDSSQKVYVWFDALINYVTSAGYPFSGDTYQPWPATHLIGKDIVRFHCIYWPSFLMACDLPIPRQAIVHGHWLMGGKKMSKSRGNVADPVTIADYYGEDFLRYFLARYSILDSDCDFSEERLNAARNDFIDKFCNLMTRSLSKNFSIERALQRYEKGEFEEILNANSLLSAGHKKIVESTNKLVEDFDRDLQLFSTHKILDQLRSVCSEVNAYFSDTEPWRLKSEAESIQQDLVIFTALDSLRCFLILLQPFMPTVSNQLLDLMKVDSEKRSIGLAMIGADTTYGKGAVFKKGSSVPLWKLKLNEE
ncbi:unnamed protein product [Kuraishia capsulata CBS 1993]|uniref:Probable methionine--tRNA ligase, mitochondrial n=1 Tax=Kuraishia capsulata CBS 1993 TaxID=1382522 RepID=W6MPY6_9ASCO|nr:uncharacterized protein KUCA_T00003255001 [Kuraishia capsulata CBS 1993]CDK27277.1 unnamed protein product [Kuraishia capsulata CBS 1993]